MSTPSKAAKAAALLHMTWGVANEDGAVKLYDELMETDDFLIDDYLHAQGCGRWEPLEGMREGDWAENLEMLAGSIDACVEYFKEK